MAGQTVTRVCSAVIKRHISKGGNHMASRAILISRRGWYVIRQFTDTDHIVVTRITTDDTGMIIGARTESARGMAVATILITGRTR